MNGTGCQHLIAGGLASIIHGEIRATLDVDLLADLRAEQISPLASALKAEFFVDAESIQEAVAARSSFNVIHKDTLFKVDVSSGNRGRNAPDSNLSPSPPEGGRGGRGVRLKPRPSPTPSLGRFLDARKSAVPAPPRLVHARHHPSGVSFDHVALRRCRFSAW